MRAAALHVAQASRWIHHRAGDIGQVDPHSSSPISSSHLLQRLAQGLDSESLRYCQWKGLWRAAGDGDTDLLVHRSDAARFRSVAASLGFKPVLPSGERQIPGVESFLGHDPALAHPVHLHVQYQLFVGDYWRTVYRLPIEEALLASVTRGEVFPIPSPPYQFLMYTLRKLLRLPGWPLILWRPHWLAGIQGQLDYLEGRCDREEVASILAQHLPSLDLALLDRCLHVLRAGANPLETLATRRTLHRRLASHIRHPSLSRLLAAAGEKVLPRVLRPMLLDGRTRPATGGLVVALIGGEGSGTSTCARELRGWLGTHFPTMHAPMARPARSLLRAAGAVKAEAMVHRVFAWRSPVGMFIQMLLHLYTARARFQWYRKAQRFAVNGGVVICEGYPLAQNRRLLGPSIPAAAQRFSWWAELLGTWEGRYYDMIQPPQAICVLRLDPDSAVRRRPEKPEDFVRTQARVIWDADWTDTPAHVIDAGRPLPDVLGELRTWVWSAL
jgi:thymidylate kinase